MKIRKLVSSSSLILFLTGGGPLTPMPSTAVTISQNFTGTPQAQGWSVFGNINQFHWNSANQNLEVTWDSTQPNSYFYHPLGTVLTRDDDFHIEFDLLLTDIASGTEAGKTGGLEIGVGLLNFGIASDTNFMRGAFGGTPSIAEFDYFPAGYYEFGGMTFDAPATTTPTFISTNSFHYAPTTFAPYEFELPTNLVVHVSMNYTASNQTLVTALTTNGNPFIQLPNVVLNDTNSSAFTASDDYRVDTFAICSYSSMGDDFDSVLGHGIVDNISVSYPLPIQNFSGSLSNGVWHAQFIGRTNWLYTLERSVEFHSWNAVSPTITATSTDLSLQDTNPPAANAFYRVRAIRP